MILLFDILVGDGFFYLKRDLENNVIISIYVINKIQVFIMFKNLIIIYEFIFNGNKVYIDKEGLVVEYLEGIELVFENVLE